LLLEPQQKERTMSIQSEPHFEVLSPELAGWIEKQGVTTWWNVDGDPLLTDRLAFPCPGDELAEALRSINRPLLIQDPKKRQAAKGQPISAAELDSVADQLGNNVQYEGERPFWADNRIFYCCWKGSEDEWLLAEDRETSKSNEQDELALRAKK
jgi:hypothetical protein